MSALPRLGVLPARRYRLRLSVGDVCPFRCGYCRPAGAGRAPSPRPSPRRLARVTGWLARHLGTRDVRLTGGEPLVRDDIVDVVDRLRRIPEINELSLTTNGAGLAGQAAGLARAGLARVNVSLDSVDPVRFAAITGGGRLEETMAGIEAALAAGLVPLKLNAVLLRSSWREDVPRLLSQAAAWGAELRFIELMPAGSPEAASRRGRVLGVGAARVRRWLAETARVEPLRGATGAAARKGCVLWEGQRVEVGWITPLSDPFCATCDRIRVDARGRLRRCLMDPETFPLAERLERGGDDGTVAALRVYLARKSAPRSMRTAATMDRTGG